MCRKRPAHLLVKHILLRSSIADGCCHDVTRLRPLCVFETTDRIVLASADVRNKHKIHILVHYSHITRALRIHYTCNIHTLHINHTHCTNYATMGWQSDLDPCILVLYPQRREEEAAPAAEPFKLRQFKNVKSRIALATPSQVYVPDLQHCSGLDKVRIIPVVCEVFLNLKKKRNFINKNLAENLKFC